MTSKTQVQKFECLQTEIGIHLLRLRDSIFRLLVARSIRRLAVCVENCPKPLSAIIVVGHWDIHVERREGFKFRVIPADLVPSGPLFVHRTDGEADPLLHVPQVHPNLSEPPLRVAAEADSLAERASDATS